MLLFHLCCELLTFSFNPAPVSIYRFPSQMQLEQAGAYLLCHLQTSRTSLPCAAQWSGYMDSQEEEAKLVTHQNGNIKPHPLPFSRLVFYRISWQNWHYGGCH